MDKYAAAERKESEEWIKRTREKKLNEKKLPKT